MANRYLKQFQGTLESGIVKLFGEVVFGGSGAVSSQDCKGFNVAKTAGEVGRYTITLEDSYNKLRAASVILVGPADNALDDEDGMIVSLRNVNVAAKTLDIQLSAMDDGADGDPTSGNKILIELTLKNTSLPY